MLFRSLHTDNRVLKFAYEAIRVLKMVSYECVFTYNIFPVLDMSRSTSHSVYYNQPYITIIIILQTTRVLVILHHSFLDYILHQYHCYAPENNCLHCSHLCQSNIMNHSKRNLSSTLCCNFQPLLVFWWSEATTKQRLKY